MKRNCDVPMVLRDGTKEDFSLVMSTWIHSYVRNAGNLDYLTDHDIMYQMLSPLCMELLLHNELRIAVSPDDENFVIAWALICKEANVIHYCWCRPEYRRNHVISTVLSDMWNEKKLRYTFETLLWRRKIAKSTWQMKPELLKKEKKNEEDHKHQAQSTQHDSPWYQYID